MKKQIAVLMIALLAAPVFDIRPLMQYSVAASSDNGDLPLAHSVLSPRLSADGKTVTIGNYIQIAKTQIAGTIYEYVYTAVLTNSGAALKSATARVTSSDPYTVVIDGELSFGNVSAVSARRSGDTFSIRHDSQYPFNPASLKWDISSSTDSNPLPTAHAGEDQTIALGGTIQLDGSKSTGASESAITYRWTIVGMPEGSTAVLSDASVVRPTFVADLPGDYVIQLICSDAAGESTPTLVKVSVGAVKPTSNAGEDQRAQAGDLVKLDGSKSVDRNGLPLTYLWTIIETPEGSAATLDDPRSVTPSFTVDRPGSYKLQLIVSDDKATGDPDLVEISTAALPPTADAGEAQSVALGATVTLDGNKSKSLNGLPLTYAWSFVSRPEGSLAELEDAATATPQFIADQPGDYVVKLVVGDSASPASEPATVLISTHEVAPVADAGEAQAVTAYTEVTLDGSESHDPQGYPLTYAWTVLTQPEGSDVQLSDAAAEQPTFTPEILGTYVFQLIVNNGNQDGEPATVKIEVAALTVEVPDLTGKTLEEAESELAKRHLVKGAVTSSHHATIAEGNIISQTPTAGTSAVAGASVALEVSLGPSVVVMVDTPDVVGMTEESAQAALAALSLTKGMVSEEHHATIPEGKIIRQSPEAGAKVVAGSAVSFVVSLGPDIVVPETVIVPNVVGMAEAEARQALLAVGLEVTVTTVSSDVVPAGQVISQTPAASTPVEVGTVVTLVVSSSNPPPTAHAGEDQTIALGGTIQLDGSKSTGAGEAAITYRWTIVGMPEGSTAILSDASVVRPTFVADLPGDYVIQLICSDAAGESTPTLVKVSVGAVKPTSNAGEDQRAQAGDLVKLDGSKSVDRNGLPLTYFWTIIETPEGSAATLDDPRSVTPSFTVDRPGSYKLQLIVSDDKATSDPDLVEISTAALPPTADAGEAQSVALGATVTLDGSKSKSLNGLPLTYSWSFVSRPEGSLAELEDAATATPQFTADQPGDYVVKLVVGDSASPASEPATVLISTHEVAPVANAGEAQTVTAYTEVTLDGSESHDPQGYPLTYAWTVLTQPEGSDVQLSDAAAEQPTFTPEILGTYVFQLIVNNGNQDGEPATVKIEVAALTVEIPDLTGKPLEEAESELAKRHLVKGTVTSSHHATIAEGKIISQTPTAGATVVAGASVALEVSLGPIAVIMVETPDILGLTSAEAQAALAAAGLTDGAITETLHDTVPAGRVVSQNPAAGALVAPETAVSFVISLGKATTPVPNVVGMAEAEARQALLAVGLEVTVTTVSSDVVPAGQVISQTPAASTPVEVGTVVTLVVSSGPSVPGWVTVPNVEGKTEAEAVAAIIASGLVPGAVMTEHSDTAATGNILYQSPSAGAQAAPGTAVNLVSSSGPVSPGSVNVPDVVGMTQAGALGALWVQRLKVNVTTAEIGMGTDGRVIMQNPRAGSAVDPETAVTIVVTINLSKAAAPKASAGPDQRVEVGEAVTLDGSGSSDTNGLMLEYEWAFIDIPYGSAAALDDAASVTPGFTADVPGRYELQLTVKDAFAKSMPDTVVISTEYLPPVANAGAHQHALIGDEIALDGSASKSLNDLPLQYRWAFAFLPTGSGAALVNPETMNPTFTVDAPGDYWVQLTVSDDASPVTSNPATVLVSTSDIAPVAVASADQGKPEQYTKVTLNGGGSYDPQGYPLAYQWSVLTQPLGSDIELTGSTAAVTDFTPVVIGTYVLQLIVNNGEMESDPSTVKIAVTETTVKLSVPDVVGMQQTSAEARITEERFTVGGKSFVNHATVPAGEVIGQNPAADVLWPLGAAISLSISIGPVATTAVPGVGNLTEEAARAAIAAASLRVGGVTYAASDTIPEGSVISQTPATGSTVDENTIVDLVISLGPPVPVPDVVGKVFAEAYKAIEEAGFTMVATQAPSETIPVGTVFDQNPAPPAEAVKRSEVRVLFSYGTANVTVPDVAGKTLAEALMIVYEAGLVAKVWPVISDTVSDDNVISQNLTPGDSVARWTHIDLDVSVGSAVTVPDVTGIREGWASSAIISANLLVGNVTRAYSETVPSGIVIDQNPAPSVNVAKRSKVDLVVSLGKAVVTVPLVTGKPQAEAAAAIKTADLTLGGVATAPSDFAPAGSVISQHPAAFSEYANGSKVDIVISQGASATVPDVAGRTEEEARAALEAAGLRYGASAATYHATIPANSVTHTVPGAGAAVVRDSNISVYTSKGSTRIQVPDVTGMTDGKARAALEAAGLRAGVSSSSAYHSTIPVGSVVYTSPGAGSVVDKDSYVSVYVSKGSVRIVPVPDVTGMTEDDAKTTIEAAGLKSKTAGNDVFHPTIPSGSVVSTSPGVGVLVESGESIYLMVSSGSVGEVQVPDVRGMTEAAAQTKIAAAGLKYGRTSCSSQYHLTIPKGMVSDTFPGAGAIVATNSTVSVCLNLNEPLTTPVPDVTGMTLIDAQAAIEAAGLTTSYYELGYVEHPTIPAGSVVYTIPGKGVVGADGYPVIVYVSKDNTATVEVPDVTGMTLAEAKAAIEAAGLQAPSSSDVYSTLPIGSVVDTYPYAGTKADVDSYVHVYVSAARLKQVPDVTGMTETAAWAAIEAAGLTYTVLPVEHPTVPADSIVYTDPGAGTIFEVNAGNTSTNVQVYVSKGRTQVPDVTGMTEVDAKAAIEAAGLTYSVASSVSHPTIPAGSVVYTNPESESPVVKLSLVTLYVSAGAKVSVPDVSFMTQAGAKAALEAAGLKVSDVTGSWPHSTMQNGNVVATSPNAGALVEKGSYVGLYISSGLFRSLPDVSWMTESAAMSELYRAVPQGHFVVMYVSNPAIPAGSVVYTYPPPGVDFNYEKTTITVVESSGPEPLTDAVTIPDVRGMTVADASALLESAVPELVVRVSGGYSTTFPIGNVVAAAPGAVVSRGEGVRLYLSNGIPYLRWVPDVTGMTETDARNKFSDAYIYNSELQFSYSYHSSISAGSVVNTWPPAEAGIGSSYSVVTVNVSKGPDPLVPDVRGITETDAIDAIKAVGLKTSSTMMLHPTIPAGSVVYTSPREGLYIDDTTSITLYISSGADELADRVEVPDVTGMTRTDARAAIEAAGLKESSYTGCYETHPLPAFQVAYTSPGAGASVVRDSSVALCSSYGFISVPDVTGMTQADAVTAIKDAGLQYYRTDYSYHSSIPAGSVIRTSPPSGGLVTQYRRGGGSSSYRTEVTLTVSLGNEPILVPDVTGMTLADAQAAITSAGLSHYTSSDYYYNPSAPVGSVAFTLPGAGASALHNESLEIYLYRSMGRVPDVTGMTQTDAEATIKAAGLTVDASFYNHPTVPVGQVFYTSPGVGGLLSSRGVNLYVSSGSGSQPTISVPDVTGMTQADARMAIRAAGLEYSASSSVEHITIPAASVAYTLPGGGALVNAGTTVTMYISAGQRMTVSVPDVTGMTATAAQSAIASAGLRYSEASVYHATIPAGFVAYTVPGTGSLAGNNDFVSVYISQGSTEILVPDVAGRTQAQAQAAMEAAGLGNKLSFQYHPTIPAGTVIYSVPSKGAYVDQFSRVEPSSVVMLVVSSGAVAVNALSVPDVIGLSFEDAEVVLDEVRLEIGNVATEFSETVAEDGIISQSLAAGSAVVQGSAVDLVVSSGPTIFHPGDRVEVACKVIGAAGGTVEGLSGTPIAGVSATFPAGALEEDTTICLGYNTGTVTPRSGVWGGVVLDITTDGTHQFNEPVSITMSYKTPGDGSEEDDSTPIPYYINDQGRLELMTLTSIDEDAGTFTFITFHASRFTRLSEILSCVVVSCDAEVSNYALQDIGFSYQNEATAYCPKGLCFGMAMFSDWYYEKITKSSHNRLRDKDKGIQKIIASRAGISTYSKQDEYSHISDTNGLHIVAIISSGIRSSRNPVVLNIGSYHEVVAYAVRFKFPYYEIHCYDPNIPDKPYIIIYMPGVGFLTGYQNNSNVTYTGLGTGALVEPFEDILADADVNFHDADVAQIYIEAPPENEAMVSDPDVVLKGHVYSAGILVDEIVPYVALNDGGALKPVGPSVKITREKSENGIVGKFEVSLKLQPGRNIIYFIPKGYDCDNKLVDITGSILKTAHGGNDDTTILPGYFTLYYDDAESKPSTATASVGGGYWHITAGGNKVLMTCGDCSDVAQGEKPTAKATGWGDGDAMYPDGSVYVYGGIATAEVTPMKIITDVAYDGRDSFGAIIVSFGADGSIKIPWPIIKIASGESLKPEDIGEIMIAGGVSLEGSLKARTILPGSKRHGMDIINGGNSAGYGFGLLAEGELSRTRFSSPDPNNVFDPKGVSENSPSMDIGRSVPFEASYSSYHEFLNGLVLEDGLSLSLSARVTSQSATGIDDPPGNGPGRARVSVSIGHVDVRIKDKNGNDITGKFDLSEWSERLP